MELKRIELNDQALLRREKRYRANANWILLFVILWVFVLGPFRYLLKTTVPGSIERELCFAFIGIMLASVLWGRYALALKLRHIQSIKEYRPDLADQGQR